ncbi:78-Dihydro-6-hydroxymethylpterin-pyrophosphokinase HPPK [Macrophomina phaseolina MS6]|uniref:2-amino-4-hydroxy-6-hydroxymethyldihydropteridine diphosphokinase n=1 Tax=Macrophomina phaseolina (strain MS6) TaxID=1126212 RepID=K2RR22_MACPH|nr:78-Dihydro-6-hydroxymethylpterin-pyrophosphokinase HPPK [Macrophomina phaseolina MS6]
MHRTTRLAPLSRHTWSLTRALRCLHQHNLPWISTIRPFGSSAIFTPSGFSRAAFDPNPSKAIRRRLCQMPLLEGHTGRRSLSTGTKKLRDDALPHRAFIALGSNLGDRIAMIERACNAMESRGDIRILRTSSLWETKAMYVEDQGNFVNGACEVSPSFPIWLISGLKFWSTRALSSMATVSYERSRTILD